MSAVSHYAGAVGALSRSRPDDDPDLISARHNLRVAKLEDHIERVVAEAPDLSLEQLDRLAVLLRGAAGGASR